MVMRAAHPLHLAMPGRSDHIILYSPLCCYNDISKRLRITLRLLKRFQVFEPAEDD